MMLYKVAPFFGTVPFILLYFTLFLFYFVLFWFMALIIIIIKKKTLNRIKTNIY